jgi:transposase-like protein
MNGKINNISCPECGGIDLQKYGTTKAGLQKYRCKRESCGHQFVFGSDHRIDSETKEKIIKLLSADVDPKIIHATYSESVSLRWIYSLKRKLKDK